MNFDPALMTSIEQLGYSVTVGDIAASSGLEINQAQKGLLALASETQGNLLVSETGDILYKFSPNFRSILTSRYWQLKVKEWFKSIWKVVFYLIRISFGIILILSILLMAVAIILILVTYNSNRDDNDSSSSGGGRSSDGGGGFFFWGNPFSSFWLFSPNYESRRYSSYQEESEHLPKRKMNFLESVFSFLFGDGDPNADLEQRRWNTIGTVVRNNQGSIISEQVAPYLDNVKNLENDDYILPVLTKFNGYPEVSPTGEIIYYFPDLQVTAKNQSEEFVSTYLQERPWEFTQATSGQLWGAIGLGSLNIALVVVLGSFLKGGAAVNLGGLVGFVSSIYTGLIFYAVAFMAIPAVRYFWIKWRNQKLETRNLQRREKANWLQENINNLQNKLNYARQFAQQKVIKAEDITYSTEKGLLEQSIEQSDKIDEEWKKRLESS